MPDDKKKDEAKEAPAPGPSKVVLIISMVVPGLLAGGASFAGSMMGAARGSAAAPAPSASAQAEVPGPTVRLTPFVLSIKDDKGASHPMKVSIAVELAAGSAESEFDSYEPRVRDATIRLLRNLTYDEATNRDNHDGLRDKLLGALKELGLSQAQQVWFVDFVIQ